MKSLSINNLSFLYNPKEPSGIKNLNLELPPGSIHALLGPSGSGKTTILKLLNQEIKDYSGLTNIKEFKVNSITSIEGDFTGHTEPLAYLTEFNDDIDLARELLFKFEITNIVHRDSKYLSNGEKQRLFLAKLFMKDSEILLFDESFSGIDYNNRQIVLTIIKEIIQERQQIVLWSTQLAKDALKFSDSASLLQFGQLEQTGTPLDLLFHPKTLFTARFFGPVNTFLLKNQGGKTISPFGELPLSIQQDGVLVLKPEHIKIGDDIKAKVVSSIFDGSRYLNTFTYNEQKIYSYSMDKIDEGFVTLSVDLSKGSLLKEI